jgi:DNA modification methylase
MEIKATSIVMVPINKIIPNDKNNNLHNEEQKRYARKIFDYQGFRAPLLISNRTGKLVAGHLRLEIAKEKGVKELPCMFQDFDSEEQEYAHLTADNALAAQSSLDFGQINADILELGPFDIELLGIKDFVIEPIEKLEPQCDEDDVPEVVHPITRKGDIWLLGNHRLMCGDSTMIDDVEKLMNGEKADMVFTDPPYGVSFVGVKGSFYSSGKKSGKDSAEIIINDELRDDDLSKLFLNSITNAVMFTKNTAAFYIFFAINRLAESIPAIKDSGLTIRNYLIWDKGNVGYHAMGAQYKPNYESFIYCHKTNHSPHWYGDFKEQTLWSFSRDGKTVHPTQKPVSLVSKTIENSSKKSETILDLFGGSGASLISCEKTGRKSFTMELDEKYCDVIIKRFEQYTGKKVTLELTGQTYEELKVERDNQSVKSQE